MIYMEWDSNLGYHGHLVFLHVMIQIELIHRNMIDGNVIYEKFILTCLVHSIIFWESNITLQNYPYWIKDKIHLYYFFDIFHVCLIVHVRSSWLSPLTISSPKFEPHSLFKDAICFSIAHKTCWSFILILLIILFIYKYLN